jgi:hypothetical protein
LKKQAFASIFLFIIYSLTERELNRNSLNLTVDEGPLHGFWRPIKKESWLKWLPIPGPFFLNERFLFR